MSGAKPKRRLPFDALRLALGPVFIPHPLKNGTTRKKDYPADVEWRPVKGNPCQVLSELTGVNHRTMQRWAAAGGVPIEDADRVAVAIGLHPGNVWPEWWSTEMSHDDETVGVDT